MPPQQIFGVRDIARLTGVGRTFVHSQIAAGKLPATRVRADAGKPGRFAVRRDDLVRWLLTWQFDLRLMRRMLNGDAGVVTVAARPGVQTQLLAYDRVVPVDCLFRLAEALHQWPTWAVVVDLPAVGSAEAVRSLGPLAARADRPELIGLFADEVGARPEVVEVFDALLPLSRSDAAIARSVAALNPAGRVRLDGPAAN